MGRSFRCVCVPELSSAQLSFSTSCFYLGWDKKARWIRITIYSSDEIVGKILFPERCLSTQMHKKQNHRNISEWVCPFVQLETRRRAFLSSPQWEDDVDPEVKHGPLIDEHLCSEPPAICQAEFKCPPHGCSCCICARAPAQLLWVVSLCILASCFFTAAFCPVVTVLWWMQEVVFCLLFACDHIHHL